MSYYMTIPIVRDFAKVKKLFEIVSKDNLGYIAGGMARYMCSPKAKPSEARDVDVFTSGEESYNKLVQIFRYKENLIVKHENDISITFRTDYNEVWKDCPMINLVKPICKGKLLTFANKIEDILNNFDFSICRVGIISETECIACSEFLHDEKNNNISILKMESPVATIMRIAKYAKKGYKINVPEVVSILKEWDDRGLEYRDKIYNAVKKFNDPFRDDGLTFHSSRGTFSIEDSENEGLYQLIRY
jgi:hypothetical protein